MKKIFGLITVIIVLSISLGAEGADKWANFRYLIGTWKTETPEVTNIQQYMFLFNETFIRSTTRAVFKPTAKKPEGEIHEDLNLFSFDGISKTIKLRSFYSEGFVNIFTLSEVSEDGTTLIFTTRAVENAPKGTRAKLVLQKISDTELMEKFHVAWPDKDYACVSDNRLKKIK
jgi:hypothetical protein